MDRIEMPDLVVDFRREEVRGRCGARIELRAGAFAVLRYLAAKAGELATKDELLAECWPGVIVGEDSLTQCISEIRRALGEGGRGLIRTVSRRGYALVLPPAPSVAGPPPSAPGALARQPADFWPSIAVLPFDEFGAEAGTGLLGAGFAEDITTELARNRELTIIARHSAFAAEAQGKPPAEVAALLGVRYVVEGSIRHAGERMIVNAQLIDARDSRHVWAERYGFSAAELFAAQDELVARIAGTLFSEVRAGARAASLRHPPADLGAYELVLQSQAFRHRHDVIPARALAARAVALDPGYGRAHISLGFAIAVDAGLSLSGTVGLEVLPEATAMIRRGIELEPAIAYGHQALGYALFLTGRLDEALQAAEHSIVLGPNDAEALTFLSIVQGSVGRYAAALASIERALRLSPLLPGYYQGIGATALYALDRFEEASWRATAAMERDRSYTFGYAIGAAADMALGRETDAAVRIAVLLRDYPGFTMQSPRIAQAFARDPALRARFLRHLRDAGLPAGHPGHAPPNANRPAASHGPPR